MIRIFLLFSIFISSQSFGQEFSFSVYNESNGIQDPYIYSIQQNERGFLCFTSSEGAYTFDGISFERIDKKEQISEPFFKSILIAQDQSIYLGANSGGIYRYSKGELKNRYEFPENVTPVISIVESDGVIYAFYQNGQILALSENGEVIKYQLKEGHLYTKLIILYSGFVASHESGAELFNLAKQQIVYTKSLNIDNDAIESMCVYKDNLFLGTGNSGLYIYNKREGLKKIILGDELDDANIKAICSDKLSSIWISAYNQGVFELKRNTETGKYYRKSSLDRSKGLPSEYITDIFIDRESNMWLGSYGQGLIKLNSNFLVQYHLKKFGLGSYIYSITGNSKQYCGMDNGLVIIDNDNDTIYPWALNKQLPKDKIRAVAYHKQSKTLYIGTKSNGIYYAKNGDSKLSKLILSADNLSKAVRHLNILNNKMYVSTLNGLYQVNLETGVCRSFKASDGLPHNTINSTFQTRDGKILIATVSSGLFYLQDNKIKEIVTSESFGMLEIMAFVEDRKGGLWMATNGQGLLHFSDNKLTQLNKDDGLFSDFVYQLSLDKKNTIWCGHNGGLSRVNMNGKVIQRYDKKNKIQMDFSLNATNTDDYNNIWFGTSEGVLKFSLFHDKYSALQIRPVILSVYINDNQVDQSSKIFLPSYKNKLRINFRAISLANPEEVFYQYRIKDVDNKWSQPSLQNFAEFAHLTDDEYILEVRSRIGKGEWTKPFQIAEISVEKPVWKDSWFLLLVFAAIIGFVALVVSYRTKALQRQKDELEVKLAIRTKEIERQKNQIKAQFTETQDSINYAVRIQKSLLPDELSLKEILSDSFLYIQPKDKVSGDFYYFEKFENRVIISAADATGHGVPGAFISLIGFVSLKEIVNRKGVTNPALMLTALDSEINRSLHQYNGSDDGKDGMDMAICEIDLLSLKIKMASALRPIWIFRKGVFEKIRSSKSTIGGGMNGKLAPAKEFDLEERQLEKGDTIYMFSDGYVDQFGSKLNKKLLTKRFLNLIQENNHRPMDEQGEIIAKYLNDWKGDFDQTDDILVIGIRV